jgi:DNA invertase Pin-like site-specific DNA recombinase
MKIGYARVSTAGQELEIQRQALEADGCERVYLEKESGAKRARPELNAMLDSLRPGDVVTVHKLDRLARSLGDLLEISQIIRKAKAELRIMGSEGLDTTTDQGRLMFSILGAFADFERSLIVGRTSRGREAAMARGVKFGPKVKYKPELLASAAEFARQPGQSVTAAAHKFGGMSRATLYNYMQKQADLAKEAKLTKEAAQ